MVRPRIGQRTARRLFLDRHLLLRTGTGSGKGRDLSSLIEQLGAVQIDSVNTLARAHDLILWTRRSRYRPDALQKLVARDRAAFEHWTHDAAAIPIAFYPMWRLKFERDEARLSARWPLTRRAGWGQEIDRVLRHVSDAGPVSSLDVGEGEPKRSGGWWDWHPSKTALEFLWRSGQLAVCHRRGFRKYYDLAERVIPAEQRAVQLAKDEIVDRALSGALERLGFATSGELAAFFEIATREEAKRWCREATASRRIIEVDVELVDGSFRRSVSTETALESLTSLGEPSSRVRILSPFDPALRDRRRAERLFGFHYRIEIFVPEAQRRYGYYVFPVLEGDRMIGRLDAKRSGDRIAVRAFWPETGVTVGAARTARLKAELDRLCRLAEASEVAFDDGWLRR